MSSEIDEGTSEDSIPLVVYSLGMSFVTPRNYFRAEGYRPGEHLSYASHGFNFYSCKWSSPFRIAPLYSNIGWSSLAKFISDDGLLEVLLVDVDFENYPPEEFLRCLSSVAPRIIHYGNSEGRFSPFLRAQLYQLMDSATSKRITEDITRGFESIVTYHSYAVVLVQNLNMSPFNDLDRIGEKVAILTSMGSLKPRGAYRAGSGRALNSVVYLVESPATVNWVLENRALPEGGYLPGSETDAPLHLVHSQRAAIRTYFENLALLDSIVYIEDECRRVSKILLETRGKDDLDEIGQLAADLKEASLAQSLLYDYLGFKKDTDMPEPGIVDRLTPYSELQRWNNDARTRLDVLQKDIDRQLTLSSIRAERIRQEQEVSREYRFNEIQILVGLMVVFEVLAAVVSWLLVKLDASVISGLAVWGGLIAFLIVIACRVYSRIREE